MSGNPGWQSLFRTERDSPALARRSFRMLRRHGEPLLLLPEQGHLAAASLSLHSTRTGKARLLKSVLRAALRVGFPLPLEHAVVPIDPSACFSRFLTHEARTRSFPQLAVLAGNPRRPGRRFIVLLFGEHRRPARVVKAGVGSAAMDLVEWERAFLESAHSPVDWMPRLFAQYRDDGECAFSMEFVEGDSPGAAAEGIVGTLVNAWVHKDRLLTVAESPQWRQLETTCAGRPLMSRLRGLRTRSVRSVVWHGDLAPWNIRVNRRTGRCVVLDWERSHLVGLPGWDWFHFTIQTGLLLDNLSAPGLFAKLNRLLASDGFSAYANRCGIRGFERQLVLAYLLHRVEVLGVTDGREHMRALLGLLAEAWTA